jgi:hypothetical protein
MTYPTPMLFKYSRQGIVIGPLRIRIIRSLHFERPYPRPVIGFLTVFAKFARPVRHLETVKVCFGTSPLMAWRQR